MVYKANPLRYTLPLVACTLVIWAVVVWVVSGGSEWQSPGRRLADVWHDFGLMLVAMLVGGPLSLAVTASKSSVYDINVTETELIDPMPSVEGLRRGPVPLTSVELSRSRKPSIVKTGVIVTQDNHEIVVNGLLLGRKQTDALFAELEAKVTSCCS